MLYLTKPELFKGNCSPYLCLINTDDFYGKSTEYLLYPFFRDPCDGGRDDNRLDCQGFSQDVSLVYLIEGEKLDSPGLANLAALLLD